MNEFAEHRFTTGDGLSLYWRDYGSDQAGVPILCLPGLTRNCRDFHHLARHLADGHRVLCPDMRGRGQSDRDPDPADYDVPVYVNDVTGLLASEDIGRVVLIGTSLGGIMGMVLAARFPGLVAGLILNDIGPVIAEAGVNQIRAYIGQAPAFDSWEQAVRAVRRLATPAYPGLSADGWQAMAHNMCRQDTDGKIRFDYDPAIAQGFQSERQTARLWHLYDALLPLPVLLLHGALSSILSRETVAEMKARKPDLEVITLANRGHVRCLTSPNPWPPLIVSSQSFRL